MSKASKIWNAIVVAVVVALVAGLWFGRPAYHRHKEARSMKQARAAMARNDFRTAALNLRVALALNSSNLAATRLMADLSRRGFHLRKPPIYRRVGIPGSGGSRDQHAASGGGADWWRNDYEFCICWTRGGKLPSHFSDSR